MNYTGEDISVLISVYRNTKLSEFKQAIDSVSIQQTVKPGEIIIVIDGEIDDNLFLWINDLYHKNNNFIKLVKLTVNRGLALALSEGIKHVDNLLIARMDADDIAVNNRFEHQLEYFNKYEYLSIMGGYISEFVEDVSISEGIRSVPIEHEDIIKFSKFRSPFNHPTIMAKKEVIIKAGGYQSFGNLEDYYLWLRIIDLNDGLLLNSKKVLVYMRSGIDLYKRRGSINYLYNIIHLKSWMLKNNHINIFEYTGSLIINGVFSIIPSNIRRLFYKIFLRGRG